MGLLKAMWFGMIFLVLFVCIEIVLIGSMWVLRICLMWFFDVDYVLMWKEYVARHMKK